ncbi:uncharacterized protein METZ01_LOCUS451161, partial [marine metagenome]
MVLIYYFNYTEDGAIPTLSLLKMPDLP